MHARNPTKHEGAIDHLTTAILDIERKLVLVSQGHFAAVEEPAQAHTPPVELTKQLSQITDVFTSLSSTLA